MGEGVRSFSAKKMRLSRVYHPSEGERHPSPPPLHNGKTRSMQASQTPPHIRSSSSNDKRCPLKECAPRTVGRERERMMMRRAERTTGTYTPEEKKTSGSRRGKRQSSEHMRQRIKTKQKSEGNAKRKNGTCPTVGLARPHVE